MSSVEALHAAKQAVARLKKDYHPVTVLDESLDAILGELRAIGDTQEKLRVVQVDLRSAEADRDRVKSELAVASAELAVARDEYNKIREAARKLSA